MNETILFGVQFVGLYLIAMHFITRMMLALIAWGVRVGLASEGRKEKTKYTTAAEFYNAVSKPLSNQYQEREKRIIDVRILGTGQALNF